jgi:hypothetical protein
MEDELINCPHCNANNIIITKDGLCQNCKQILTDKNKVYQEVPITEQKNESNSLQQLKPWHKKPLSKRIPWTIIRKSIVFIGVAILLLCPVVFFCIIAFLPKKGVRSPEEEAIILTQLLTFIGWLTCEIGLILSKTSRTVNIISRIAIYLYIVLGQLLLGIVKMFSAPWP